MRISRLRFLVVTFLLALVVAPGSAQPRADKAPGRVMISIYHVAPGKHVEFLKWRAERDAVDKEAGAPPTQMYAHMNGDSWDFLSITPELDGAAQAEMDKKVEAIEKKKGLTSGPKASMEIRQFISSHTDTLASGPMTAAQMVEAVK